jgi:hypothetical protein
LEAHDGIIEVSSTSVPVFADWRPGGNNLKERYWYGGTLAKAYEVVIAEDENGTITTKQVAFVQ